MRRTISNAIRALVALALVASQAALALEPVNKTLLGSLAVDG